jgi:hypothetical protein
MIDPDKTLEPLDEIEWLDEWAQSNRIPTKVELTIAIQQKGSREEPTEYIRTIEIPMAAMSWDLVDSSKAGRDARVSGGRHRGEETNIGKNRNTSGGYRPKAGAPNKSGGAAPSGGGGSVK